MLVGRASGVTLLSPGRLDNPIVSGTRLLSVENETGIDEKGSSDGAEKYSSTPAASGAMSFQFSSPGMGE